MIGVARIQIAARNSSEIIVKKSDSIFEFLRKAFDSSDIIPMEHFYAH